MKRAVLLPKMPSARMSQPYRELLVDMFTGTLVAAKPDKANAHTMGLMAEAWVYSTLGLGGYKAPERYESNLTAVDPVTGEVKKNLRLKFPNYSGTLVTGGGLVFIALMDGTISAHDDATLDELWKVNVGSGFAAPPMSFEVNGKQYIAVVSGPSNAAKSKLLNTPELRDQRHSTVLYVFAL